MKNKKDSSEMMETKPSDRVAFWRTNMSFLGKKKKQSVNRNIVHTFGNFSINYDSESSSLKQDVK